MVTDYKEKYGKIYKVNVSSKDWYYRAMSRLEYKDYNSKNMNDENMSQLELEDMIFITCNLNEVTKEDINDIPAGVISIVADNIMKATGFTEDIEPEEL